MLDLPEAQAFLFDLDGVLTPTAVVHRAAWAETFDSFLASTGRNDRFTEEDYLEHVDGKPRYDGVRSFLASRDIRLPEGSSGEPGGYGTVRALGNLKNEAFRGLLGSEGIAPYPGSQALLDRLDERNTPWAVVSSSANAVDVLQAAGLLGRPDVIVDGVVAADRGLAGKPDPATFLEAAEALGIAPPHGVVVEDAISGVRAGRAGGFGLVIAVAREVDPDDLASAGAHRVIADLSEIVDELP